MAAKSSQSEVMTINLQPFLMPGAIVLSALIIGASFLAGVNNLKGVTVGSTTATTPPSTTTPPAAPTGPVTVSIDDDPYKGDRNSATVAIVEFSDYECPFCQRHFQQTYSQLVKDYVDTGKIIMVFRDYPLSFHEPAASREANGANCVNDLAGGEKYFQFHDYVFTNTPTNGTGIDQTVLSDYAASIGVNKSEFDKCVSEERFKDEIAKDTADGSAAGVSGTPGFIVGTLASDGSVSGEVISGAQPFSVFQTALENYL